jgi:formylglycine-generating enzyme required for sulfatase activity
MTDQALAAVKRSPNATYVLPTESEWYKSAYFSPQTGNYFLYPTQSNTPPSNVLSVTGMNNANFLASSGTDPETGVTPVGAFLDSPGPYNTYDQGGDVSQWTETIINGDQRVYRGGSFLSDYTGLESIVFGDTGSSQFNVGTGFRIAEVPEPASAGLIALATMITLPRRRK